MSVRYIFVTSPFYVLPSPQMSSPDDIYENEISRPGPLSLGWRVESGRNKPVNRVEQQREWESVEACNAASTGI
jgi:hypothetical protein